MKLTSTLSLKKLLTNSMLTAAMLLPAASSFAAVKTVSERLNASLTQGQTLDLLDELQLHDELMNGDQLLSLKINAKALGVKSGLRVLVNGQVLEKARLDSQMTSLDIDLGNEEVTSLELKAKAALIKKVSVDVDELYQPNPYPMPQPGNGQVIRAHVYESVYAGDVLKIKQLVRQATGQRIGQKPVAKVVLKGTIYSNAVKAQLLVNGMPAGSPQKAMSYEGKLVLKVPPMLQQRVGKLQVRILRGQMDVNLIKVKLKAPQFEPVPRVQTISVPVHHRVAGGGYGQLVSVQNLLAKAGRSLSANTKVLQLSITARGMGTVTVESGYMNQGTMHLQRRGSTQTFGLSSHTTLSELLLDIEGRARIENITLKVQKKPRHGDFYDIY